MALSRTKTGMKPTVQLNMETTIQNFLVMTSALGADGPSARCPTLTWMLSLLNPMKGD
ncbi:hypothetical protein E2C01_077459 [Portunus trituberculatus]|uniref:Uncharacterized protein n=1 Tax=Portunus trituberculatus TaxID=210409 RepID=A0A5B7IM65_PORTR|nr:hypothetical protein [Portunus trituberculatus]